MGIKEVLLEKVSKVEIEDALNNPNVMVGAEYEFRIKPFLEKYKKFVNRFDQLNDMEEEFASYEDAYDEYTEDPDNHELPALPEWAVEAGYEEGDDIPPPSEIFTNLRINKNMLFDKLIRDFLPLKKLPFKNYVITPDHTYKSARMWIIKPDGSLGLSGVEIVSPVMSLREFLDICPKVFEFISSVKGSEVGDDCGFHIGISLKNVKNLGDALDIKKLSLFTDEGYIYKFFKEREYNTFAKSAHETIQKAMIKNNAPELLGELVDEEEMEREYPDEHYMAINIEHLKTKNEYVEFRYLGAANYHRKWDRIRTIIAHYVHALSIACDVTYKDREYKTKMSRLLNKIELFTIVAQMNKILTEITDDEVVDMVRTKKWKALWSTWKALYLYKEAVDKDVKGVSARKGFEKLCIILGVNWDDLIWNFSDYR